ncbi:hypothetical protein K435DRAFT_777107 [Dendrothele bispora CBS 962.96]|uniref:SNF2 family DNA-dependent ATPase n=1 Tax=Dendrothele bispora (strain CBS 962.96) TaxID=1314807 RepID=A0A4S8MA39_DENBC|nr:hypothetical protein K435DRAFT_777107 [Dendrothele bispora CBS 962.96]
MYSVASSSSPSLFDPSEEPPTSTAASSPPPADFKLEDTEEDEKAFFTASNLESEDLETRYKRLENVLEKSALYAKVLEEAMETQRTMRRVTTGSNPKKNGRKARAKAKGKKRTRGVVESDDEEEEESNSKRRKTEGNDDAEASDGPMFLQSPLVTGAQLKDYQLEGVQWMSLLHNNGIAGILADEMGLGKTLQTIAFTAHLRDINFSKPILIVCPLSVLHNWIEEYQKFAPTMPVCMYHGIPEERAELRRTVLRPHGSVEKQDNGRNKSSLRGKSQRGRGKGRGRGRSGGRTSIGKTTKPTKAPLGGSGDGEESEDEEAIAFSKKFPIVVTTYEMIIKDRAHLAKYDWGYIVVDEGHRLKNLDCKVMREIKKYPAASRMILTGTPLHNNLSELWALLNFILPDIFTDLDSFQEWFNLPTLQSNLDNSKMSRIIDTIHGILKPFLLRRLKADVETNLPPKKEYVLYAPLTVSQREAYDEVLSGSLRQYLLQVTQKSDRETLANEEMKEEEIMDGPRKLRKKGLKNLEFDLVKLGEAHRQKVARQKVNNMKLQNTVMQLRKVCSHPFLFDWPLDPVSHQPILNDDLVAASGKMMVLDRLLSELFSRKHKVLLFSQFTTMLDIIEDWAVELKGWKICRIDGSTGPLERREQMNEFQNGGDSPDAPQLFLLSTRAGGLGINLVAADTVIFYDQDWNPQMDAQAQDRAHRIGQTKPVLIFRLVSAHTIETKIMQRASEKRQLEALVIAKGKFKAPTAANGGKSQTMAEMATDLLKLEGEKIDVVPNTSEGKANVLSDRDLEMLLDRSPEVFAGRGKGWTSSGDAAEVLPDGGKKAAFAVFEAPKDEGNDALARMLGEESDSGED